MREFKDLLKNLVELSGISGYETTVREFIASEINPFCDELWEDAFGNLIARIGKADGYKIGVYAHMDEVGMVVKKISPKGMLAFDLIGMIDDRILPGSEVKVCCTDGSEVIGVIGNKSKHLQTKEDGLLSLSYRQMLIDVGATSDEEVKQLGIEVGCPIVFPTKCNFYSNGRVLAKSLDNRVGCLTLITVFKELYEKLENSCIYGFFTAQEEVGSRGAEVVANGIDLDMIITLDTAPVLNSMDVSYGDIDLGKGPVIRLMDGMPDIMKGMISNRKIVDRMMAVAKERSIAFQADVLLNTFLDSCTAQMANNGLPGGSICFPRRYSHTAVEMCDLNDIDSAITLLAETLMSLDESPILFGKRYK